MGSDISARIPVLEARIENITVMPDTPTLLQEKTATENGDVTADEGYDGLSKVVVNVPVPDGYVKPDGALTVTANGTYDVTDYASVSVSVSGGTVEEYDGSYTIT